MVEHYGLPEGLRVIMNNSAYMDDETWVDAVEHIAPGIRQMPVIKEHPKWFTCLTFDGFKLHVNTHKSLDTWAKFKHRVTKEEAVTSHVNQAYDQQQARADKRSSRELLDMARSKIKGHIDQWQLIAILIVGIKNLPAKTWTSSFKSVNLHPKHRISFPEWCVKINDHLVTEEKAYVRTNETMYAAMPAYWKNMSVEQRQKIAQRIDTMKKEKDVDDIWTSKPHLLRHAELVNYKQIPVALSA